MKFLHVIVYVLLTVSNGQASKYTSAESHALAVWQSQQNNNKFLPETEDVITVGLDAACDFKSIQEAIQSVIIPGEGEIRIATIPEPGYVENLSIKNMDLTIRGSYANCIDAKNNITDESRPIINGGGEGPVLKITSTEAVRNEITLRNLSIDHGQGSGMYSGGGISTYLANLQLNLYDVNFYQNEGVFGGGLSVFGGDTDVYMDTVRFSTNAANYGGGLYCLGPKNSIFYESPNSLNNNSSEFQARFTANEAIDGGAAYVTSGCVFTNFDAYMASNEASNNGGAVAVTDGGKYNSIGYELCVLENLCFGDQEVESITAGRAGEMWSSVGKGGAIYASDRGTAVRLGNTRLDGNLAEGYGGALAIENGAILEVSSQFGDEVYCGSKGQLCNHYIDNRAEHGGFLYVGSGGRATIGNAGITGNRAEFGVVAYMDGRGSYADIEGSIISENGGNYMGHPDEPYDPYWYWNYNDFYIQGSTDAHPTLILDYNTIVNENINYSIINNKGGHVLVRSSIFHNPGLKPYHEFFFDADSTYGHFGCVIVNDDADLPESTLGIHVFEELTFDEEDENKKYRLDSDSPALDRCGYVTADYPDVDGEPRGIDQTFIDDDLGPYDIGADELPKILWETED